MKILFISDFSLHHSVGGAQRSNDIIFKEGLRRGHTITMLHIDMDYSNILNKEFDLVISSNMEYGQHSGKLQISPQSTKRRDKRQTKNFLDQFLYFLL